MSRFFLGALCLLASGSYANAQDIQILMQNGDVVPGVGTIDNGFSSPFIRLRVDDNGDWMAQFEYDNSNNDALMRSGSVYLQDGDPVPGGVPAGATINEFDSFSINNVGDVVLGLSLDGTVGGTADNAVVLVNSTLIAQEGNTPPGSWGAGTFWIAFDEARITDDLSTMWVVGRVDDPTTTATGSDYYGSLWSLDGALNLVSESVLARGFETLTGMVSPEEVNTLGTSFDGQGFNNLGHVMFRCSIRNAIAGDAAVYMNTAGTGGANNMVLAFEGVTEPSTGQPWGSLTAPELDMNDNGDWLIRDQVTTPTTDVIIKNGVVFKQDGDLHPAFGAQGVTTFGNLGGKITANGDVLWFAEFGSSTNTNGAYFFNDTLLVQESVTMANGGGLIDEIRGFNSTSAISPNGRWFIFECEVDNVDTVCLMDLRGNLFSLCNGDGGDQLGCTDCPCGNNSPMGTIGGCLNSATTSSRLGATGDPSVSLPAMSVTDLRFDVTLAPPLAFCILNSGDAVAPQSMANPCFGLDSGAQAAQFDGLRCAVQNTVRHGGRSADGNGDVGVTNNPWGGEAAPAAGIANQGAGFAAGQTRFFQVIHRDDPLAVCTRGLNTTQAIGVTFTR